MRLVKGNEFKIILNQVAKDIIEIGKTFIHIRENKLEINQTNFILSHQLARAFEHFKIIPLSVRLENINKVYFVLFGK